MSISPPLLVNSHKHSHHEEELIRIFKTFDINTSGGIDLNELVVALKELGVTCSLYTTRRILESLGFDASRRMEADEFLLFFEKASDKEQVCQLLSQEAQKFVNYKANAESGDPNFSAQYKIPSCLKPDLRFLHHLDVVQSVAWLDDLSFVSGSLDGTIATWSVSDSVPKSSFKPTDASIYSLCPVQHQRSKVVAGLGNSPKPLCLVNTSNECVDLFYSGHEETGVTSTAIHGSQIVSGSTGGRCLLHDTTNSDPISILLECGDLIECVSFGSRMIAAAHHTGYVSLLDSRSHTLITRFEAALGKLSMR